MSKGNRFYILFFGVIALGAICSLCIVQFSKRYHIGLDIQAHYSCLPFELFLVDRNVPATLGRGQLVEFTVPQVHEEAVFIQHVSSEVSNMIEARYKSLKYIAAVPGDKVEYINHSVFINGEFWDYLHRIKMPSDTESVYYSFVVPRGSYFVLGTSPSSVDSRYWGLVQLGDISGVASALL